MCYICIYVIINKKEAMNLRESKVKCMEEVGWRKGIGGNDKIKISKNKNYKKKMADNMKHGKPTRR